MPGNVGGPGRPASAIRERCRGSFDNRLTVLESIADGDPVQEVSVSLASVLVYAACPTCKARLTPNEGVDPSEVKFQIKASAAPADRIKAVDTLGKYGLDARTQMGVDEVKERLRGTLAVIREELGPQVSARIIERIRGQWAA